MVHAICFIWTAVCFNKVGGFPFVAQQQQQQQLFFLFKTFASLEIGIANGGDSFLDMPVFLWVVGDSNN